MVAFGGFVFDGVVKNKKSSSMFVQLESASCSSSLRQLGDDVLLDEQCRFAMVLMSSSSISYNGMQSIIKSIFFVLL